MVSVHYNGTFYEATPWLGDMKWHVTPWGYWNLTGRCTGGVRPFEVELTALCDAPGVKLRAPTEKDGMKYFCRDSFMADATLSLWELEWSGEAWVRSKCVIDAATSSDAAVELGGGPWWDDWEDTSIMKQPMKGMVRLPYRLSNLRKRLFSRKSKSKEA
jgi:tocopherol cyclase